MKCNACDFDDDEIDEYSRGFIKIIAGKSSFNAFQNGSMEGDNKHPRSFPVEVYACPKCGTMKIGRIEDC